MISGKVNEVGIHVGDTVRVHTKVVEGAKERIQIFEGILIRLRGRAENATFTVRKIGALGVGVERTWPVNGRSIVKMEIKKKTSGIRRSKLYYLRDLTGKEATRA